MKISIQVQNMMCEGCCNTISSELSALDGISNVDTNLVETSVTFHYNDAAQLKEVKATLDRLGYPEKTAPTATTKSIFSRITDKFFK